MYGWSAGSTLVGKLVGNRDKQFRKFVKPKRNSLENMRNWEQNTVRSGLAVCPTAKLVKLRRTMSRSCDREKDWYLPIVTRQGT